MEPLVLSLVEIVCKDNVIGYNKLMSLLQKNNIITDTIPNDIIIKKNVITNAILHILNDDGGGKGGWGDGGGKGGWGGKGDGGGNNLQLEIIPSLHLQLQEPKLLDLFTLHRYNNYTEICELGSGSYGNVYKTYHIFEQSFYAIKKIESIDKYGTIDKNIFREIQLFSKLEHPNIVRY